MAENAAKSVECRYSYELIPFEELLREDDVQVAYVEFMTNRVSGTTMILNSLQLPLRIAEENAKKYPLLLFDARTEKATPELLKAKEYDSIHNVSYLEVGEDPFETLISLGSKIDSEHKFVRSEERPKEYWMGVVDKVLEQARGIPSILEIYLAGSLANGKKKSKDVDLVFVVDGCEAHCHLVALPEYITSGIDPFCLTKGQFEIAKRDKYKITKGMQKLYPS